MLYISGPLEAVLITQSPTKTTTKTTDKISTSTTITKITPGLDLHPTTSSASLVKNLNVQATTTSPESTVTSTQSTVSSKQKTTLNKDEDSEDSMAKILQSQKFKPSTTTSTRTTTEIPIVKQKVGFFLSIISHTC